MPENRGEGSWREGGEQGGKEWEAEHQHHDGRGEASLIMHSRGKVRKEMWTWE